MQVRLKMCDLTAPSPDVWNTLWLWIAEITRVRNNAFYIGLGTGPLQLPEPHGPTVTLMEKIVVPIKEHPDVSFVELMDFNLGNRLRQHIIIKVINYYIHFVLQFNFVGRLLGPRGLTTKQLELDTGCKILIRGQGSMRDKQKVFKELPLKQYYFKSWS